MERVIGETSGIGARFPRDNLGAGPFAPNLNLLDRGGTEGIARGDDGRAPPAPKIVGELADRRGLARTVDADNQHDVRLVRCIHFKGNRHGLQYAGDLLRENPPHFLGCDLLVETRPPQFRGHAGREGHAEIRADEKFLEGLQRLVIETALGQDPRESSAQLARRLSKTPFEARKPAGPLFVPFRHAATRPISRFSETPVTRTGTTVPGSGSPSMIRTRA